MGNKKITGLVLFMIVLMLAPLFAGGQKDDGKEGVKEKIVTLAMTSPWDTLFPYGSSAGDYSGVVTDQIYDKLISLVNGNEYGPRLAKEWEFSADYKSIILKLNENAKWHDGESVTANDVFYTFELLANPESVLKLRDEVMQIVAGTDGSGILIEGNKLGVDIVDEHTIKISFDAPTDPDIVLYKLAHGFVILPEHICKKYSRKDIGKAGIWTNPIGSGPFKYESSIPGERIELTVNEGYFLGTPSFDRLIIKVVPAANLSAGLISGDIDITAGGQCATIPLPDWQMLKESDGITCISQPSYSWQAMTINNAADYLTADVRKAFRLAINRQAIVDGLLSGEGEAATAWLTSSHKYRNTKLVSEYDPEEAQRILDKAGWDKSRVLLMVVPTGNQVREQSAPLIQQDLARVGVKSEIQMVDFPTLMRKMKDEECDLGLIGQSGSVDPDMGYMYYPESKGSAVDFCNIGDTTYYDTAVEANKYFTFEQRKPLYDKLQEYFLEMNPYVILYYPNAFFAYRNRISNIQPASFLFLNFRSWEWEVE